MTRKPCLRLEAERDNSRGAMIYHMKGKLTGKPECYEFLEDAREKIEDGCLNVVLHLEQVDWFNSTGVGIVAALFTSAKNRGGRVFVVATPERVQHLLEVSNLWQFLVPCDTIEDVPTD